MADMTNQDIRAIFDAMLDKFPEIADLLEDSHETMADARQVCDAIANGQAVPVSRAREVREFLDQTMPYLDARAHYLRGLLAKMRDVRDYFARLP